MAGAAVAKPLATSSLRSAARMHCPSRPRWLSVLQAQAAVVTPGDCHGPAACLPLAQGAVGRGAVSYSLAVPELGGVP